MTNKSSGYKTFLTLIKDQQTNSLLCKRQETGQVFHSLQTESVVWILCPSLKQSVSTYLNLGPAQVFSLSVSQSTAEWITLSHNV